MKRKLYNRCMGECCEDIGLKVSPQELETSYYLWLSAEKYGKSDEISKSIITFDIKRIGIFQDIHLIYPMLKFIKKDYSHPEQPKKESEKIIYHYTCRFFDKKKRECAIYNIRPNMCRTYPNNGVCRNPKCRWKKQVELRMKIDAENKKVNIKACKSDKKLNKKLLKAKKDLMEENNACK